MSIFGRRGDRAPAPVPAAPVPSAALLSPSRQLAQRIASLRRQAQSGPARVLLTGPASSRSIETFHGLGCRVTVDGDRIPELPLGAADEWYDLVLGYDTLDLLGDAEARALAQEWARVLRSGGALYLLARRELAQAPPPLRVDVAEDGALQLTSLRAAEHDHEQERSVVRTRQNADFTRLLAPLAVEEIALRRDGWREILGRKR